MSFNIAPDKHLLINQSVIFLNNYPIGSRLFSVSLENPTSFYNQQPVILDNGLKGIVLFSVSDGSTYIYTDTPSTAVVSSGFVINTKIPFSVQADNDVVTTYDIKKLEPSNILEIEGIKFLGKDGLFKSEWLQKINEIKSLQVINSIEYDLTSATQGLLGFVKFDGKHKFGFRNSTLDALFEIDVSSKDSYTIRKLSFDNISGELTFSFNIGMIGTEKYIAIYVQNLKHGTYDNSIVNSRQEIKSITDINFSGNGFILDYQINNIMFDDSIFVVNSDGKDLYITQPIEILSLVNLRTLQEGTYYCNNQTIINGITDLPKLISTQQINGFVLKVLRTNNNINHKIIEGSFVITNSVNPENNVIHGTLYVDGNIQYSWVLQSTVYAENIITNVNKQFVTQNQIDSWNTDSSWLPPVNTIQELSKATTLKNGDTCFVINEKEVYYYNLGSWSTSKTIVSATQNGILSKEQYVELFNSSSLFKKVKNTVFNHRDSTVNLTASQNYIGNNIIDLTKRTNLTNQFGSNVFNFTSTDSTVETDINNSGVFGTNSVGLGVNIKGTGNNITLIGNNINSSSFINIVSIGNNINIQGDNVVNLGYYNVGDIANILEVGNGSVNARSNIFSINRTSGITTAGGYSINGGTGEQILLANGAFKDIGSLQQIFGKYVTDQNVINYGVLNMFDDIDTEPNLNLYGDRSVHLSALEVPELESTGLLSTSHNLSLAVGDYSASFGYNTRINSFGGLVIGHHNDPIFNYASTGSTIGSAALFIVGNGISSDSLSNAFVVLSNGETQQKGDAKFENGKGLLLKTADGLKSAIITLVNESGVLRLNIQEL